MTADERRILDNELYKLICPLLEKYEAPYFNAHARTQIILNMVSASIYEWIDSQSKTRIEDDK